MLKCPKEPLTRAELDIITWVVYYTMQDDIDGGAMILEQAINMGMDKDRLMYFVKVEMICKRAIEYYRASCFYGLGIGKN
jgi:hypothetical protein